MKTGPSRIVSLLSSNTELVCALGLKDRLVGISHECDFPESIANLPRVTRTRIDPSASSADIDAEVRSAGLEGRGLYEIDEESLANLRPDLLLTQAQCEVCAVDFKEVQSALNRIPMGSRPRVLSFQPDYLDDVFADLLRLGEAAGVESLSQKVVAQLRARVSRVVQLQAIVPAPRRPVVLTLEWLDPPMPGGCWTPQLVSMAAGKPTLRAPGEKSRVIDWKAVAETQAEILVILPCGFSVERTLRELPLLLERPEIRSLPAFSSGRIYVADGNALFNRPGPRLVDSLEFLAHSFHPELSSKLEIPCPAGLGRRVDPTETWGVPVVHDPAESAIPDAGSPAASPNNPAPPLPKEK